jgi:uncharacterized protein DUF5994
MSIAQVVVQSPEQVETSSTELLSSQVWSPSLVVNRPLRLRLSSIGQGALDGAWWPFSPDLTAEALDLVDHFPALFDRIRRVVHSTPDWDAAPPRIKAAEVFVSLVSFPRDDTHRASLKGVARPAVLQLLVVPPERDERAARHAMRIAAMPSNVKSAATILTESGDQDRAGLLAHWDDDGGTNRTSLA